MEKTYTRDEIIARLIEIGWSQVGSCWRPPNKTPWKRDYKNGISYTLRDAASFLGISAASRENLD